MSHLFILIFLTTGALFLSGEEGRADTIRLTSGEVLEGKILRETAESVTIQVPFSPTIMEDRVVPRAEIASLEKMTPDELAFREIQALQIPENAFEAAALDPALAKVRLFVAMYPQSAHAAHVKKQLAALEAEQQGLRAGQIRLQGRLLSFEEISERADEIAGLRQIQEWQAQADSGNFVGAINRFLAWEAANTNNPFYPDAVDQARSHLRSLQAILEHEIRNNSIVEKRREEQIALSKSADQATMRAARQRQEAELKASIAAAKKNKDPIPPYAGFSLPSLEEARKAVLAQSARLAAINLEPMRQSLAETARAREAFAREEWAAARSLLDGALAVWPTNAAAQALLKKVEEKTRQLQEAGARQAGAVQQAAEAAAKDAQATE